MPNTGSDFVFIHCTPNNVDPDLRKVKGKATKLCAARQPPLKDHQGQSTPFKSASQWNRYQARTRVRRNSRLNTFSLDTSALEHLQRQEESSDDKINPTSRQSSYPNLKLGEISLTKNESRSDKEKRLALVPHMQGAGWVPPFVSLGALNKVYVPFLLEHYLTNLATEVPELDAGHPFILRTKWFPMVITSAATLNIVLLTSASHYAVCHRLHHNRRIQEILLHLKYQTLTSTNKLINASSQRTDGYSDAVIGAVAKMASYEAMFGLPELYHTHMRGLQTMIRQRGGLGALGLDGLLERMVLWIDINSAFLLHSSAYFLPMVPLAGHVVLQQVNPSGFLGAS